MITANDIINKAITYIGTKEYPSGSNNVIFNTHYYDRPVNGQAYPWCAAFVWDIFRMCNASYLFFDGNKTAYCPAVEAWARKNSQWFLNIEGQPGDLCLMCFSGNTSEHIGITEKRNSDGTYTIIEGNTSVSSNDNGGNVMRRIRGTDVILGFARPKYLSSSTSGNTVSNQNSHAVIASGQNYAKHFTNYSIAADGIRGIETKKAAVKTLQKAINLDYTAGLAEDGIWGTRTSTALGRHYVMKGETQYLVTALEILLMLKAYDPNGVEEPGIFGSGLESCLKRYQAENNLTVDGIAGAATFKSLLS